MEISLLRARILLNVKIDSGVETKISKRDVECMSVMVLLDGTVVISNNITDNISQETLKEIFSLLDGL